MDKIKIKQICDVLSMVTGDCPYERGIGKEENFCCHDYGSCVECWQVALSKHIKEKFEGEE